MEINDHFEHNLQKDISVLLKTLENKIAVVISARDIIDKGVLELKSNQELLMRNLFQIEDNLRESSLMMNRCLVHLQSHKERELLFKDNGLKIDIMKKQSMDLITNKEDNKADTNNHNDKIDYIHHVNNTHDTSEIGSMYINSIKPKLNFTYNSEDELKAIMHLAYLQKSNNTKTNNSEQNDIRNKEHSLDLNEPIKEIPPNRYSTNQNQNQNEALKEYSSEIKQNQLDTMRQFVNKQDMKIINEQQLNTNEDNDDLNDNDKEIEDDTLNKLIIQNNEEDHSNINPIDTASKIKTKATKVAQLVTLINSNPDLDELLSQLFESDDIIGLLLSDDVDENLIDSIYVSIEEIERLQMIDECKEYDSQISNSQYPISKIEQLAASSYLHPIIENESDFNTPIDSSSYSSKPNNHLHKKQNTPMTKDNINTNTSSIIANNHSNQKKQRKRTKINLITCPNKKQSSFNGNKKQLRNIA